MPQTLDLLDAEELGAPTETGARPDLKAPPSSPPVDRDALDRHFAEPHLHEFSRRMLELVASQPEIAIHEVADTKPFPGRDG